MNTKKRRIAAFFISVAFVFITFLSLFFIVKEENHHCTGEDCPVCACIHQAEQTLRSMGTGTAAVAGISLSVLMCRLLFPGLFLFVPCTSLISQKVRLND